MPELPEVQTTVNGLQDNIIGLEIKDVWTNYNSSYFKKTDTIKDPNFFKFFKKTITGQKVIKIKRRAKNILIELKNGNTILIHMKMTGHLLYGLYKFTNKDKKDPWEPVFPESLKDPFNKRIRFLISFNNGRHLALSDTRKFAKITLLDSSKTNQSEHLKNLGPEPLDDKFTLEIFKKRLSLRPNWKIKQALMDQTVLSGIGNIYADESLWRAGINPLKKLPDVTHPEIKKLFRAIKQTLSRGISLGGDSMSDYRNILGEKGNFQEEHRAYQKTGERCSKKSCNGTIQRIVVAGRATHYCNKHQRM